MKKIISMLLISLILISIFLYIPVFAKNPVELRLTDSTVYASDEFEVRLFISDNSQLSGAVINLQYDASKLEFVSAEKGAIIDEGAMVSINNISDESDYKCVRFTYLSPSSPITSEGVLLSVKFKALPNAEGKSNVKILIPSDRDFVNIDAEKLAYIVKDSTINIINTTVESTSEADTTLDVLTSSDVVESTNSMTVPSNVDANADGDNGVNDYVKIVTALFIAGGIILIGVIFVLIISKKKKR